MLGRSYSKGLDKPEFIYSDSEYLNIGSFNCQSQQRSKNITTKSGYKTTEFWVTLVTVIVTAIVPLLGNSELMVQLISAVAAGLAAAGYSISRGMVKKNNA